MQLAGGIRQEASHAQIAYAHCSSLRLHLLLVKLGPFKVRLTKSKKCAGRSFRRAASVLPALTAATTHVVTQFAQLIAVRDQAVVKRDATSTVLTEPYSARRLSFLTRPTSAWLAARQ
jgi:hypothetical protein